MSRRRFTRSENHRETRKLFTLAVEGRVTEPEYFKMLGEECTVRVYCLKNYHACAPLELLNRIKNHLDQQELHPGDEAWVVLDKDQWPEKHLGALQEWASQSERFGLSISNPCFELWLLWHFEDPGKAHTSSACRRRLKQFLPHFDKSLPRNLFQRGQVQKAVARAKSRDQPPCHHTPRTGVTTVYRLVERILANRNANPNESFES